MIGCVTTIIPDSVTTIGDYAFNNCRGSGSLIIPDAVTSIGEGAFNCCSGFTSVTFGNSVTTIGNHAFCGCTGLTAVYYSGDISQWCSISLGDEESNPLSNAHNLYINNSLLTELAIPENVAAINQYAFYKATCLTGALTIPNTVTSIGDAAFYGCTGFTGNLSLPISVTSIGEATFCGCTGFTGDLTIPNAVTSIGYSAFSRCSGFTTLTIGNSVTSIGVSAFFGCSGLTDLTIGNSVTSIDSYTFYNCSNLTSITSYTETPPTISSSTFYNCPKSIPLYVPCGSLEAYQSAAYWSQFTNIQEVCSQIQTITLAAGTNWFSTYLDITLEDLQTALVEAMPGATSITIKSQRNGQSSYNGTRWRGALGTLDVALMYQITVPESCEITLEGLTVDPAMHPVTIKNGPNWIAFPFNVSMTPTETFGNFPVSGDRIQSKSNGQANYTNRWRGALSTLMPGQGYIYISTATEDRTFTYPTSVK